MTVWRTGSGKVTLGGGDAPDAHRSPSADAAFRVALELHRAGRSSDAVASARQTLAQFPDHVPTLHLFAQIMRALGQPASAFEALSRAITVAPENVALYNDAGLALATLGHHNEATAYFTKAIELDAKARAPLVNRANTYARMQRLDEAIAGYEAALALNADDSATLTNLASVYEHAGRFAEAAQTVRKAMASGREDPALNVVAARLERHAGRHDKAKARLELMQKRQPDAQVEAAIVRELGHVADARADYPGALKHYRRANKLTERLLRGRASQGTLYKHLDALERWLEHGTSGNVRADTPERNDGPVFIVGFPGAGTHTLGAALQRGSLAQVSIERTVWGHLMTRFVAADHALSPALRAELMAPFLVAPTPQHGPALIEVLALGLLYAPLQMALFPDARFVYVRRDPDDTLLTAATQTYLAPEIAPHLLKPAAARRLLERFEQCWASFRERLGARAYTLNYESIFHADAHVQHPAWTALGEFLNVPDWQAQTVSATTNHADDESRFAPGHARHYAGWLR